MPHSQNQSNTENKTETLKERIMIFLTDQKICKNQFYKKTGISNGTLDKKSGITADSITKIHIAYPNINLEWLIMGKGEMFKPQFELYPNLLQVKDLDIGNNKPKENNVQDSPTITVPESETTLEFIPIYAYKNTQQLEGYLSIPKTNNCDGAGYVETDSMYPLIKPGDIVCYKTNNDSDYIHWGEMYVIYLKIEADEFLTIKYLQKSDLGEDYVQLTSHNPVYNSKDILRSDIEWKAIIKASIRYNSIL